MAITIVVIVMMIALTALFGVLAASLSEFSTMLPQYNKELTRKIVSLQEMMPFLNCISHPSGCYAHGFREGHDLRHYPDDRPFRRDGQHPSAGDDGVFMLFEVRHVPYKLRFALNNPQIHIAGLHRALKGVSKYLALKTLLSVWTGVIVWLGLMLMGVQFALMWGVLAFLLNYVPQHRRGAFRRAADDSGVSVQWLLRVHAGGALFLVVHMVLGNILEPRMMGHRLGMSTLVVFIVVADLGMAAGTGRMLLSVPLTSVCKIWMETTKGGSKLAILLGPGRPKSRLPGYGSHNA
ncbi:AI-2E family transporter [Enterobacter ludwigii]|uniref:AI-2E family transporter n=1 Tax=Enterobacter ludwigii TaxID=299767 RepID=UPI003D1970EB